MTGAIAALLTLTGLLLAGISAGSVGITNVRYRLAHHQCTQPTDQHSATRQPLTWIDSCSSDDHTLSPNR